MNESRSWQIQLITPNHLQAKQEVDQWLNKGYSTHYSQSNQQVMIKKGGPGQKLFIVRTRIKNETR